MKGDFSRISFDRRNHFSQVLMQQGRVTLDADPNEQSAILLHYLRTLARDLIGPYGGPADALGFGLEVAANPNRLLIGAGRYYVGGILCESDGCDYADQPDYRPLPPDARTKCPGDALLLQLRQPDEDLRFWLYLDVWERHISWIEDADIREVALNGPDTCTRAKVVWQVRALELRTLRDRLQQQRDRLERLYQAGGSKDPALKARIDALDAALAELDVDQGAALPCFAPLASLESLSDAWLAARLDSAEGPENPCEIAPDAAYRGAENQLYRVEIHQGGDAATATFKWSRDNGSQATPWLGSEGDWLLVASSRDFALHDWVEITDESDDLDSRPGLFAQVAEVAPGRLRISAPAGGLPDPAALKLPKLRRWNQRDQGDVRLRDGAVPVTESASGQDNWINLENGVQIRFAAGGSYCSGDYWLIPARVATGDIQWPHLPGSDTPGLQAPHGVEHHYAPLGWLGYGPDNNGSNTFQLSDCRCDLWPINSCARRLLGNGAGPGRDAVPGRGAVGKVAGGRRKPAPKPPQE